MEIRTYFSLPEEAKSIRITVFCEEQGFVEEFDDADNVAVHLVAFDGDTAIGTCRYYETEITGCYLIGRIAVCRSYRGRGIGGMLVRAAEAQIVSRGGTRAHIGAQVRAMPFYESIGYTPVGERYMDEHVEHQGMEKELAKSEK
ncbi:MAG: GNAT family N-acetyltransferase [Clostridia bacterium]|nr:GNAT family N-acetyltransferase [Clostridia bacterium]